MDFALGLSVLQKTVVAVPLACDKSGLIPFGASILSAYLSAANCAHSYLRGLGPQPKEFAHNFPEFHISGASK